MEVSFGEVAILIYRFVVSLCYVILMLVLLLALPITLTSIKRTRNILTCIFTLGFIGFRQWNFESSKSLEEFCLQGYNAM
jgi:EamA domain-containing membrane protein RarD